MTWPWAPPSPEGSEPWLLLPVPPRAPLRGVRRGWLGGTGVAPLMMRGSEPPPMASSESNSTLITGKEAAQVYYDEDDEVTGQRRRANTRATIQPKFSTPPCRT